MNQETSERRQYRRYKTTLDVRVSTESTPNKPKRFDSTVAKTVDLSGGGLFLNLSEPVDVGEVLHLYFLKPKSFEFFDGKGEVIRAQNQGSSYDVGIQFIDIPEETCREIDYSLR